MSGARRFAAALVGMSLLVGCSAGAPDISTTTSSELQAAVQEIGTSAAAGQFASAVARLDNLQSRLDEALAAGQVGRDRGAQIQAAIDQVRADLGALVQTPVQAPTSSPTATATPSPDSTKPSAGNGKHKGKSKD